MCVIMISSEERPTDEMVKGAWETNDAGGGIAWREDGSVRWIKGVMDFQEMADLIKTTPMPFIAHFRIPSNGGKRQDLCHPFPIDKKVPLMLKGRTKGNVLFHNGHWGKWKETMLESVIKSGVPIPTGKWSDTRAMAFTASIYGIGVLEFIDEKAVAFGPTTCEVFPGTGWKYINKVWCSNDFFLRSHHTYHGGNNYHKLCKNERCSAYRIDGSEFCLKHADEVNMLKNPIEGDDNDELPVIKAEAENKVEAKEGELNDLDPVQVALRNAEKINASGGSVHKLLPFVQVDMLYQKGLISRNQWKKSRNLMQREKQALDKHARRLAIEKFNRELKDPSHLVVTH